MYGYGLEGYGYRYPPIEGYYEQPIVLGTVKKEGPRKGFEIKRYPPKVDEKWVAAYFLNKLTAKQNKWREYATEALRQASEKYRKEVLEPLRISQDINDQKAYARAVLNKQRRQRKKEQLPLALRSPEGQKLYEELLKFKEDKPKLLEFYYHGRKPRKPRKPEEIPPEILQQILAEAKK
jgi:hypothetical protein